MSIESNLKSISESLKELTEITRALKEMMSAAAGATSGVILTDLSEVDFNVEVPTPVEPAPTEPAPTEPAPTEPAPTEPAPTEPKLPPLTSEEIAQFNEWVASSFRYLNLGEREGAVMADVLAKHNLQQLSDIGESRGKMILVGDSIQGLMDGVAN